MPCLYLLLDGVALEIGRRRAALKPSVTGGKKGANAWFPAVEDLPAVAG